MIEINLKRNIKGGTSLNIKKKKKPDSTNLNLHHQASQYQLLNS